MDTYKTVFRQAWSPITAGALIGFINTMMFAYDSPWTVFTGLRNWGLHFIEFTGFGDVAQLSPFEHKSSVMDIAFLLGAFGAALLAREFAIRIPPLGEAIKGILGGALMGIGANLSRGCTIGGFYSSIASMSVSGLFMMAGLFIGVIIGLKYLIWEKSRAAKREGGPKQGGGFSFQPPVVLQVPLGVIIIVAGLVGIPYYYDYNDFNELGVLFCFAVGLGLINQRARFCVVRAIRDPFMTGDGEMTRAVIVAFLVAIIGFSALKYVEIKELMDHINPSAGWPALVGGVLFGIGMTIAGGCASGSLWRAGEGHVKLALAVLSFAFFAAATHLFLQLTLEYSYFKRSFLPEVTGSWILALGALFLLMFVWHLVVSWNEKTEKLVMLK